MKKGLFTKMLVMYTLIVTISLFIIGICLSLWVNYSYTNTRKQQVIKGMKFLEQDAILRNKDNLTSEKINSALTDAGNYLNVDILLTNRDGTVNGWSDKKNAKRDGVQILTNELDILRNGNIVEIPNSKTPYFKDGANMIIIPLMEEDIYQGSLVVALPDYNVSDTVSIMYLIIWVSVLVAVIISGIIIYFYTNKILVRPLKQIIHVSDKISKGEVDKRVNIELNGEIGDLATSFNTMANSIEEVEKNRREFISNVSHEIRSPITSIKGFIGGILDGVIPPEKENYYLKIAYDEIQRLTRLINDLLDLSTIESGKFTMKITRLDINEIIKICVIKFETKIKCKNINVDVIFGQDELYAVGDKDRIIQVLTNLLDNAIKYVPEGGNMKVITKVKGEKIYISVYNNGPRIPKEDIQHIWERFYKSDKSRTSKVSTGLGLPIVRSILTQLNQDIWVENKENEGVTFTFTLDLVM